MKERPILFSAPMVRAILDGRKTQTRRIVKPQPILYGENSPLAASTFPEHMGKPWMPVGGVYREKWRCPYGQPGERLWVKETHWINTGDIRVPNVVYAADPAIGIFPWRPSIHMPRWASRITLEITGIRVERLNDISESDAKAEGVECPRAGEKCSGFIPPCASEEPTECVCVNGYVPLYESLWESINGKSSWVQNLWVWVIEFKRL